MMSHLHIEERPIGLYGLENLDGSNERLAYLLTANELARRTLEEESVKMMRDPVSQTRVFALFGAMLGAFGPFSIGFGWFYGNGAPSGDEFVFPLLFLTANITTAIVGYFFGKVVANMVAATHKHSLLAAIPLLFLVGALWGGVSGFAGGLFLFVIGSVFGAIIGAVFGGFATAFFGVIYRYLQVGGSIERRHFIPLALGVTLVLSAFVLSLGL